MLTVDPNDILNESVPDIQLIIQRINAKLQQFNVDNVWSFIVIDLRSPGDEHFDSAWRRWHRVVTEEYRKAGWIVKPHSDYVGVYFFEFNPNDADRIMQGLSEKPLTP